LQLLDSGESLDLTNLANDIYSGIEKVDLTGTGNNTLSLDARDLLDFSDDISQLLVDGNAGDVVDFESAAGWSLAAAGSSIGVDNTNYTTASGGLISTAGGDYAVYTSADGLDMLLVRTDITLNLT
jgi:hypothetical protein